MANLVVGRPKTGKTVELVDQLVNDPYTLLVVAGRPERNTVFERLVQTEDYDAMNRVYTLDEFRAAPPTAPPEQEAIADRPAPPWRLLIDDAEAVLHALLIAPLRVFNQPFTIDTLAVCLSKPRGGLTRCA